MKRRDFLKAVVLITAALALPGCKGGARQMKTDVAPGATPWTHLNFYNASDNFQFSIVADRTNGDYRPGVFSRAVDKLNLLKPEFVMSIGDLIVGNTEDEAEVVRQWDEFDSLVNRLQMPFFYVPGNHDYSNKVMAKKWRQRYGPSYYYFTYKNVLFLCLNTEEAFNSQLSNQQLEYFRKVLRANSNVRWTLVFLHKPLWNYPDYAEIVENWQKFESLLGNRPYTVFAGHTHTYNKTVRNGRRHYVLATTGGVGEGQDGELLGLAECQFDHIAWVTMADDGPVMTNLLLEGILDDEPCPQ